MKDIEMKNKVGTLLKKGFSIEEIAKKLFIPIGTRYEKGSAKWYRYCLRAKENQRKAIEKHPGLYSKAGKIAQQKHPWLGKELGKKYGPIQGKINAIRLRGNSEYFSKIAKKLHEINPRHSSNNMKKVHEIMRNKGTFYEHQKVAALKCMEKNPNQLKEMSKKAHELYPLALLGLESRRKNYPYKFMNCNFDSKEEMIVCKKLVDSRLMEKPIEKANIHFRIGKFHVDFFIQNRIFVEYHPPRKFGRIIETENSYFIERRRLLDDNGFKNYPLMIISNLKNLDDKMNQIKGIIQSHQI